MGKIGNWKPRVAVGITCNSNTTKSLILTPVNMNIPPRTVMCVVFERQTVNLTRQDRGKEQVVPLNTPNNVGKPLIVGPEM